jgi:hypothetical protein
LGGGISGGVPETSLRLTETAGIRHEERLQYYTTIYTQGFLKNLSGFLNVLCEKP